MLYLLPAHTTATRSPRTRPMLVPHNVELFEGGFMVVGGMMVVAVVTTRVVDAAGNDDGGGRAQNCNVPEE